uniref:Sel1 repeat family protein n=1 Tax=Streptomyces sp. NBC_00003 TaxID=2903608 RepID=A0AAU2VDS4_9ACTN
MGETRATGWKVAGAVVVCACSIGGAALFAAGQVPGPAWATAVVGAVVAVLVVPGKKAVEALGARWTAPVERLAKRSAARSSLLSRAPRVTDAEHRMALSIHTAIPLPEEADPGLSGSLPEYISRGIDTDVRAWIKGHTKSGGLVVLVGAAAAGKTRSLYEALRAEVPDWRMPDVVTGTQLNTLVADGVDLSRSVVWLDELQNFFTDDALTANSVRQLVLGRHGPVLLAATIRAEELDRLLPAQPPASGEGTGASRPVGDQHAQEVVKMLARWSPHSAMSERAVRFHVDSRLTSDELARARELAEIDPRIARALLGAEEARITATLAGAPDLIERWTLETAGDPAGQSVITAAVVARRCGHPEPIPSGVLEALALPVLAEQGRAPLSAEWLPTALAWAESPVKGSISALRRSMTRPGVVDGFRVSDVLLQHSYDAPDENPVAPLLARDGTWATLLEHAAPSARTAIGVAAEEAGRADTAVRAWRAAAADDDVRAMNWLGWFHAHRGDLHESAAWFRRAADRGSLPAMSSLGLCLERLGDADEAEAWFRQAATQGYAGAMVNLGMRLFARGDPAEGESWYRRAAELGQADAMANLGYRLAQRGDLDEAEQWNRRGAVLGHPGAMENLAVLLKERGDFAQALEWFRRGADRALTLMDESPRSFRPWPGEAVDQGVSEVILGLARLLLRQSDVGSDVDHGREAECWLRLIAEHGDPRAAAMLATRHAARGDTAGALAWRSKAADSADDLLGRERASLLESYGRPGVQCHLDIILAHAAGLAEEGNSAEARAWREKAAHHDTPPAARA